MTPTKANITSIISTIPSETISYVYDHLDRLTSAISGLFSQTFSYDVLGRFVSFAGTSYTYPAAGPSAVRPHAPTAVGSDAYAYDANGNLITTQHPTRTYGWDVENRLTSLSGDVARGFSYDGDGTMREQSTSGSATIRIPFDDYRIDVASGNPLLFYRFLGRTVAWVDSTGTLRYTLADHLQSTEAEVSATGAQTAQRRYFPFGGDRGTIGGASDLATDERYTSQRRLVPPGGEPNGELYNYVARSLLPGIGFFSQPDTTDPDFDDPQSLNHFAYALNNPVRLLDPTGKAAAPPPPAGITPQVPSVARAPSAGPPEVPRNLGRPNRLPDFYVVDIPIISRGKKLPYGVSLAGGGNVEVIVDRYSQVYAGPSGGGSASILPATATARPAWILQEEEPKPEELRSFITGWTVTSGGGLLAGSEVIYSPGAEGVQWAVTGPVVYPGAVGISVSHDWLIPGTEYNSPEEDGSGNQEDDGEPIPPWTPGGGDIPDDWA